MKLIVALTIVCIFSASASGVAQGISLQEKNVTLKSIINKIRNQSGYDFIVDSRLLNRSKPVSVNVKSVSLDEALKSCLIGQDIAYKIENGIVMLKGKAPQANINLASGYYFIDIKGKVVDDGGLPIPGATVKVKSSGKVVVSNNDGLFSISGVNADDILQVSFIGYETAEVKVNAKSENLIKLKAQSNTLNELVIVGYGTQKKVNLTGAVTVVKGESLENRPVTNATQMLQGVVPGLNVAVGTNTKPGQSFNLNVRGVGNLSGSDGPFVLVDGVAMSLSDVNPNDIESISVLKDAAASAIYGARAPYGVILVTTKRGKTDKTSISYSNNIGLTSPVNLPEMANSYEFAKYFNAATFNATGSRQYSDDKLALLQQYINNPSGMAVLPEANDNYLTNWENTANGVANTNWIDFNYKPYSTRQNHNLSLSGGSKNVQYYISGGYNTEAGMMRYADIDFDRYNFNATINAKLTDWAKIVLNTKYTQGNYSAPFSGTFESLFFHNMLRMRPNISPYDLNGNFNEISSVPYLQSGSKTENKYNLLTVSPSLQLEPLKNWKINVDLNISKGTQSNSVLLLPGTIYGIDGTPKYVNRSEYNIPLLGSFSRNQGTTNYVSPNIYTSYSLTVNKDHAFTFLGGFQQELNEAESISSAAQDLISMSRPGISLTTSVPTTGEVRNHWGTQGYFGRINYSYKNKYLFEVNGRYDGSSRFASNSRWGFFPSVSVGYNLAEESFIKELSSKINLLKLRGSYGFLGNQSGAGLYAYTQSLGISLPGTSGAGPGWYFQNGREANIFAPAPFNALTTWEKVQSANIGLDWELFDNRLTGSLDVYQRSTKDMLGPTFDIADLFGGAVASSNNANLRTRGWELALSYRGNISPSIQYTVGGVLSDYKSVVTKYQNATFTNPVGTWYEGKNVGEIWGYRSSGLIQTADEAAEYNKLNRSFLSPLAWMPGDVKYSDLNGDGAINNGTNRLGSMGDQAIIGNTTPRYAYSFNGSLKWKGLSLSLMFQGIGKRDFAPGVGDVYFWGSGALAQVTVFNQHLDYWTKDNQGAYYPNPYAAPAGSQPNFQNKTQQVTDRYLQDASYLRLKNATISYSLPTELISKLKLSKVNIFLAGENLLTFTKLGKMFDPETLSGGTSTGKVYPLNKVYAIGLNVSL